MSITADDMDSLRHALGITASRPRKLWGFRNYYCGHTPGMDRLCAAGFMRLVHPGKALSGGDPVYTATREGCRAVGMTEAEIDRMEPRP